MWIPNMLIGPLGNFVGISIDPTVFDSLSYYLGVASTILPVNELLGILWVSVSIKGSQIIWALIIRIKSFIPTFGA